MLHILTTPAKMRALKGNLLHNSLKELHNSLIIRRGYFYSTLKVMHEGFHPFLLGFLTILELRASHEKGMESIKANCDLALRTNPPKRI